MFKLRPLLVCSKHISNYYKYLQNQRVVIILIALLFSQISYAKVSTARDLQSEKTKSSNLLVLFADVKGQVTDEQGNPLPGVSVTKKGTTSVTLTDANGNYEVKNVETNEILVFSFVGMISQEVAVNGRAVINVQLKSQFVGINEVVVVGYGTARKSDLTGAITSVSAKDFDKQPLTNVAQTLQGRAAGVQITQTSGQPGGAYKIRIRGANSITGGNEPLYVIDGQFADLSSINLNDIQSMEVLKDASSTAIYGTRGANGVVLITTKRGRSGKTKVDFDAFSGYGKVTKKLDLMSPSEFAAGVDFAEGVDPNVPNPFYTTAEINALKVGGGQDWQNLLFQTAHSNNAQLAVSGGNDATDFYISGNYYQTSGTVISQQYKRLNLRSNFNAKLNKKIKVGLNFNVRREEQDGVRADLGTGLSYDPTTPAYNSTGGYNFTSLKNVATSAPNPLIAVQNDSKLDINNSLDVNSYFNYQIAKNWVFNSSAGIIRADIHNNSYQPLIVSTIGVANVDNIYTTNFYNTNRLTYSVDINQHNSLKIDAIQEFVREKYNSAQMDASNFFTDLVTYKDLSLAAVQRTSNSETNRDLESYLGRVNYTLYDKYLFTGSLRADGTSVFQKNKWGYFPSASFAWRLSEENFIKEIKSISNLKLRLSYGKVGNQGIGVYGTRSRAVIDPSVNYPFNGTFTTGVAPSNRVANPDLTWEKTAQINAGLDLGLLNDILTLTIDYYKKNTTDLLLDTQLPAFVGPTRKFVNAGEVENKGFEFTLGTRILKNSNWSINSTLSVNSNKNKVLSLFDGVQYLVVGDVVRENTFDVNPTRVEVGKPISSFRGYVFEGVYQNGATNGTPGQAIYKDINGDGKITTDDITTIGNGSPKFTWGWNWDINYKKFNLNFLFTGSQGNDIYNLQRARLMGLGALQFHAVYGDYRNRWTPTNPSNIPSSRNGTQILSSQFIENGSYVSMKNIALGYSFDGKFFKKLQLNKLRVYASVENLFIITKYSGFNPETTAPPVYTNNQDADVGIDYNSYPISRTITFGLNVSF